MNWLREICGIALVSVSVVSCAGKDGGHQSVRHSKCGDCRSTPCWHDSSVLSVGRIFPNSSVKGEVGLLEYLRGTCQPEPVEADHALSDESDFHRFWNCRSRKRRLVLREALSGQVTQVVSDALGEGVAVDDMVGSRYTTLLPGDADTDHPVDRLGQIGGSTHDSQLLSFPRGRSCQIWEGKTLLRTFLAPGAERITCAKIIPGTDMVVLCYTRTGSAYHTAIVLDAEQTAGGIILDEKSSGVGTVRIFSVTTGKQLFEETYKYRMKLRERGPCFVNTIVPQGRFVALADNEQCEEYFRACQRRPWVVCDDKYYKRLLPVSFDVQAAVSPNGGHLAVLAFEDLSIYSIAKNTPGVVRLANHEAGTYLDRDWHVINPRLRWSVQSTRLILSGEGRVLRFFSAPDFRLKDYKVRAENRCTSILCMPLVASAHMDEQSGVFAYSRPDYGIGLNMAEYIMEEDARLELGIDMRVLGSDRLLAAVPQSWSSDSFGTWQQDILLRGRKMLFLAAGVVFRVNIATGRTDCFMGVKSPAGFILRW